MCLPYDPPGSGSPNPLATGANPEDRTLRTCAETAVDISVAMLTPVTHERLMEVLLSTGSVLKADHGHYNKLMRSSEKNVEALRELADGAILIHCVKILGQLESNSALDKCGFLHPVSEALELPVEEVMHEDMFADLFGQSALCLVARRMLRICYMTDSWPWRGYAALKGRDTAQHVLQELKRDDDVFKDFQRFDQKNKHAGLVEQRHLWHKVSVQQTLVAAREYNFQYDEGFLELYRRRGMVTLPEVICEEGIGAAKNSKFCKTTSKFRRPESSMMQILEKQVIDVRHHYKVIPPYIPMTKKCGRLPRDAFEEHTSERSLELSQIASTKQKPSWYSPCAERLHTPTADLAMLRDIAPDWNACKSAYFGKLISAKHRLVIMMPETADLAPSFDGNRWAFALWSFPDSSSLVWPAQRCFWGGDADVTYFKPLPCKRATFLTVVDPRNVMAATFSWRSCVWLQQRLPDAGADIRPAVRAVVEGDPQPLMQVAARCAFWKTAATDLQAMAKFLGIALSNSANLVDILYDMISNILGIEGLAVMSILQLRLAVFERDLEYSEDLLELDAAVSVLTKEDQSKLTEEKKRAKLQKSDRDEYTERYKEKMVMFRDEPKRQKKMVQKPLPKLFFKLTHAEVKAYIPPGSSIWRSLTKGGWMGHLPPFPRVSATWAEHGEEESPLVCLRKLWRLRFLADGTDESTCPWKLF